MNRSDLDNLTHTLFLPTLLFAAVGGMAWAVRGCVGFGASPGCIFAGVAFGTAWWFLAYEPAAPQSRRYASGWIILAMTVMFGIAGNRGWMQWPQFFNERLYTDYASGVFVPISRKYGFAWLFLAGIPWAGLGACGLAWCASGTRTTALQWIARLGCGLGGAYVLGVLLYDRFPQVFLPLYGSLQDQYGDLDSHPSLWKLVRDNREAMLQMGLYLGFLAFEIARRDWKNTLLIAVVGLINGAGWALLQNWMWAARIWPDVPANWWRHWESCGGISIGVAYGVAYFLVNRADRVRTGIEQATALTRRMPGANWLAAFLVTAALLGAVSVEVMPVAYAAAFTAICVLFAIGYYVLSRRNAADENAFIWSLEGPLLERWAAYAALILGLGFSIKNGLKGACSLYWGDMPYWNGIFLSILGPMMVLGLAALSARTLFRPVRRGPNDGAFPDARCLVWTVMLVQYTLAILISAPLTEWNEFAFALYYLLLFCITAVIIIHYQTMKQALWKEEKAVKGCSGTRPGI